MEHKEINKLSDSVSGERDEWIIPEKLHEIDFSLFDDNALEDSAEQEDEWFTDSRIGKWSDFRNSLTKKNLKTILK